MSLLILTAKEMSRIEQLAILDGSSAEAFMEEAGRKIAKTIMKRMQRGARVALLIGKGNKGGDAYMAGICLLQEGFYVDAFPLYAKAECSPLNQLMQARFEKRGGKIGSQIDFSQVHFLVDGYLGTGFKGPLDSLLSSVIDQANQSKLPIFSIDIPSGLDGTTGEGANLAIRAHMTIALGCAKSGFFLRDGWNCVGELVVEEFGLPTRYLDQAHVFAKLPDFSALQLPLLVRNRHKYQAGYVIGYGGSKQLSGAPKLSGLAALRSGAGIVRFFYPAEAKEEMHNSAPELLHSVWDETMWTSELQRAKAVFVGPGLGAKSPEVHLWLTTHLQAIEKPCVLDAGALSHEEQYWPKQVVLTPHRGEVLRLLQLQKAPEEEDLLQKCQKLCDRTGAVMVLKGGPSFILGPKKVPVVIDHGDPGMASAGTGDVLTGIIASLLAQGLDCWDAALLGAILHALAGEKAARVKTSYGLIASDLLDYLPEAFRHLHLYRS
jgi:hydroxyethylthiazole kinase-like uncharacterized protein yjeF